MKTLTTKGTTAGQGGNGSNPSPVSVADSVANNPAGTAAASRRAQVMLEFQRTSLEMSRQFLETQQNVMLAYLNGASLRTDFVVEDSSPPRGQLLTAVSAENQAPLPNTPQEQVHYSEAALAPAAGEAATTYQILSDTAFDFQSRPTGMTQHIIEQTAAPPQVIRTTEPVNVEISSEDLIVSLIEIVSERTGYPPEMLDPTLDLEADLGIDSIKRVEILNSFRKLLPESSQQSLEGGIEQLASVKSLQGIIDWIRTERLCAETTLQESSK